MSSDVHIEVHNGGHILSCAMPLQSKQTSELNVTKFPNASSDVSYSSMALYKFGKACHKDKKDRPREQRHHISIGMSDLDILLQCAWQASTLR
jgi:hypothetical protein